MAQPQNKASDALAKRREQGNGEADEKTKNITGLIQKMAPQFQLAMPRGAEAQQLVRDAITSLRNTPKLALCDPQTVLGALMTSAQLGLHVGVLGQAWPVPFYESRAGEWKAQLIIGYRGYQELAHRSGKVASFMPRVVHANDTFDIDYGLAGTLIHKPAKGERGPSDGFYSIARYVNGGYDFFHMSRYEMERWRDRFATTRTKEKKIFGPWVDHFDAMGQKTVQRILSKSIPMSREVTVAAYVDGGLRINLQPDAPAEDVTTHPDVLVGEVLDPDDTSNENDGPSVDRQHRHLFALTGKDGLNMDRDARLAWYSEITKRDINTTGALRYGEAETVIATVKAFIEQQGG